jgi:DNA-binding XRE family transcriptional regulator
MTDTPSPAELLAAKKEPKTSAFWRCRLREYRTRLGLSQTEVARTVGLSRPQLVSVENGQNTMLSTAVKLAEFYGVAVEVLWPERLVKP